MASHQSERRTLSAIVQDLWNALLLGNEAPTEERRSERPAAYVWGNRAADRYLAEVVAALGLTEEDEEVDFRHFTISRDPEQGWSARVSRFLPNHPEDVRWEVMIGPKAIAEATRRGHERLETPGQEEEPGSVLRSNAAAEERDSRARDALERVEHALRRIDRIPL